jgi:hypothetical protein
MQDFVESRNYSAFNQTRGSVLGVEIASGDFSYAIIGDHLPKLTPKSGAGLWMIPFKGIREADVTVPLDLIYLDENRRVIETVEFFPTFRISSSSAPARSVLALPVHSIYASHTQPGDQLVFGDAEEIDRRLKQFSSSNDDAEAGATAAVGGTVFANAERVGRLMPARSATLPMAREIATGPQIAQQIARPAPQATAAPLAATQTAPQPRAEARPQKQSERAAAMAEVLEKKKPKGWLKRLLHPDPPDPRKALRQALPGLEAYFWTGGAPKAHAILNISTTGLYVATEERWYPGTLIQMTLKKAAQDTSPESSITLQAKANRWGNDGVGLSFVVRDPRNPVSTEGIEREVLDRFLSEVGHEE